MSSMPIIGISHLLIYTIQNDNLYLFLTNF
nr:MAG TPA: hypothetical protein [Caudoviricetes sp.]